MIPQNPFNAIGRLLPRWAAWSTYIVALSTSLPAQETLHTTETAFHIPFNFDQGDEHADQVQLFVSNDDGSTWQLYQELPPSAGRFTFRTQDDGEFWFAVQLLGVEKGQLKTPELIVAVDREKPQIELDLKRDNTGRVIARWEIADANLDQTSLQMEYQTDELLWQPVPIDASSNSSHQSGIRGAAEWWVAPHKQVVNVRLKASDRAGNLALIEQNLSGNLPANPAASEKGSGASNPIDANLGAPPADSNARPAGKHGWTSTHESATVPPTGQIRFSRSRRFNLDYEVSESSSTVHRVEVWSTRDGGSTWQHHGDDPDRTSPYLVNVVDDGVYGFRLVVQATEGFFAKAPVGGDAPDVWVQVDSVAPAVRMKGAEFGDGANWGTLRMAWESSDENPAEHPVTLLFAESMEGPWRKLVVDRPSIGMFDWRLDQSMPARFYVRAEARDRVGNVSVHTWPEALHSHHLHPRAKIRDIRPAARSLFGTPELR